MYPGLELIEKSIREEIESSLKRTGLLYRLFSRIKDTNSIKEKIIRKDYTNSHKLMQDVIGFRITTYFNEDIKILVDYFLNYYEKVDLQYDEPKTNEFNPLRKNLVCRMPKDALNDFNFLKTQYPEEFKLIDSTFEIQFRTTLSEGWHEVEHNMRYKCQNEWTSLYSHSRILNGIYATLETSDHTLISLFENIAYQHYKNHNWAGMLRNKFRLRFELTDLNPKISGLFDKEESIAKSIFRIERCVIIKKIIESKIKMRITFDNIVFLCNYLNLKNDYLFDLTPNILKDDFNFYFAECKLDNVKTK